VFSDEKRLEEFIEETYEEEETPEVTIAW